MIEEEVEGEDAVMCSRFLMLYIIPWLHALALGKVMRFFGGEGMPRSFRVERL